MKKRKQGRTLSRTKDQHDALLNTMLVSLVRYQSIKTTLAKAKELRPFAERMLTHAKIAVQTPEQKLAKMRLLGASLPAVAVKGLLAQAELMKTRNGGYTRIIKLPNRKSDASKMAMIEWVEKRTVEEKKEEMKKGNVKAGKKSEPKAKEKSAKKTEANETKKEETKSAK